MADTLPTHAQLYDLARGELQARAPALTDLREGSNLDGILGSAAILADDVMRVVIDRVMASYIDLATEADLDRRVVDFGGPTRNPTTSAVARYTLTRGAYVGSYTVTAGTSITGNAPDGTPVEYQLGTPAVLGGGDSSVTFDAVATTPGPSHNTPAGTAERLALPPGLTLEQIERGAGGAEAEDDDTYRARFKRFLRDVVRATPAALRTGALTVAGVAFATVDEAFARVDDGGFVAMYIGDPDAGSNTALADAVRAILLEWRAAGVEVLVYGSAREEVAAALTIKRRLGSTLSEGTVKAAVKRWTDTLAPAQRWYASKLEAVVHDLSDDLLAVDQTAPADRELAPSVPSNALRVAPDLSGVVVTFVDVAVGA
jgi:uncharacterized phage protein gp47/JayE